MSTAGTIGQTGGQIGGGILGGAIGSVFGPIGTWIGRAIGSKVGGMAGRVAGEALASYMESANEAADKETKDQEAAKPCEDCEEVEKSEKNPPFKGKPGSTVHGPDNSRTYGDDGFPLTDRDAGHPNESGIGAGDHSHDWGRPPGGGPPSHTDRGFARPPHAGDPPVPWRDIPSS